MLSPLFSFALIAFGLPVQEKDIEPFPGFKYHQIKAYNFNAENGIPECSMPLREDGSLCSSVKGRGKLLSKIQAKNLFAILNNPTSYKRPRARCFTPHHAFVFFNRKGKAVGQISLCFECDRLFMEPARPESRSLAPPGMKKLRSLCHNLGLKDCDER